MLSGDGGERGEEGEDEWDRNLDGHYGRIGGGWCGEETGRVSEGI